MVAALLGAATAEAQTPKPFPPPGATTWRPEGCRIAGPPSAVLASRAAWRSLHADEVNTDEVEVAYAPVFAADWLAEPGTWNPTGPVFDSAGSLYVSPFQSREGVVLLSLDAVTGARRWAIPNTTGSPAGSGTPLVLADPDTPGREIVYHGRYDRVLAVGTDGTVLWDVPTGLGGRPAGGGFGVNHHPGADAIVGLTRDGWIWAVDRRSGAPALAAPYQLPGAPAPPGPPLAAPPSVQACAQAELEQLADLRGEPISLVIDVLLGNGVEVANYFAIDAATGRLWVAATAPDAEDGAVDGVSQLGALYGLDLVPSAGGWLVVEACHRSFSGGSATTPALRRDGTRVYVGDNVGNLIAVDRDCSLAWTLPVGAQITGSLGVASDNGEVYASTAGSVVQVLDRGATATVGWTATLDVFDLLPGQQVANQTIVGIGANAVAFQAGAAVLLGASRLTLTTGVGLLDRSTGAVRYFTGGLDESVAVMSTGPDGALYIGNSPLRRLFAHCLAQAGLITTPVAPPIGGIRKYAPLHPELTLRDAACAAADRARNANRHRRECPDSTRADVVQLGTLVAQGRRAAADAVAAGALRARDGARFERRLARGATRLAAGRVPMRTLDGACRRARAATMP